MNNRSTIAIVDATREDQPDSGRSRYLTTIANRPLVVHVVESLVADGFERVVVVARDELCNRIAPALETTGESGVDIGYLASDASEPLLPRLRRAVADGPVLVHSGDCLFPGELPRLRARFCAQGLDLAVLSASPAATDHSGSRPRGGDPLRLPSDRADGTAFLLGARTWPELARLHGDALDVRGLVEHLRAAGQRVGCSPVRQAWCYERSSERLLAANQMLLDALPLPAASASPDDCLIEGRVARCPSARIARSRVRGPVMIGADAVVEDSFIGPYTAIGPGAVVVGAEIEYTMVLAGAEVRYPRYPLEASVIGERAVVAQSFGLPAGLHLELGPDARVILG